jgi:gamma-glutamyltranspeptidase/glutathione hydrolase
MSQVTMTLSAPYAFRRSSILAKNVVSTSQPLATQAGLSMIGRGGNAVDAAIATAITLVVVEPTGNGVGSDAFAVVWSGGELHGLNASGRSPAAWDSARFAGCSEMPRRGWDSVTVPGAVSAWRDLSQRFGKLPFRTLFEPAVSYAEKGFPVSPVIAEQWRRGAEELHAHPGFAECFMPEGRAPRVGEQFRNPALARTLGEIAETNGESFYRGALAERVANFARRHDGALSEDDLAAHQNEWCKTITQPVGDAVLHEIPPNGQGIAACMALGILGALEIETLEPDSVDAWHLEIEAMKLALADAEAYVADPSSMTKVTAELLLDRDYLRSRARLIDRNRAQYFGPGTPRAGGTVCLAAADASGTMVSYIQSNYMGFGSGVVVPGTGISLQNRGHGFSLVPSHPNEVGPGKRPFHTIIPGFLTQDGAPLTAFCLMGGLMQAQGHVQIAMRLRVWGQDPQTAADAPRWRALGGLQVAVEAVGTEAVARGLSERGHEVVLETFDTSFSFGGAQIVQRLGDSYICGSDPRKDGQAAGF